LTIVRQIVRDSFALETFEPIAPDSWGAPYQRFIGL